MSLFEYLNDGPRRVSRTYGIGLGIWDKELAKIKAAVDPRLLLQYQLKRFDTLYPITYTIPYTLLHRNRRAIVIVLRKFDLPVACWQ